MHKKKSGILNKYGNIMLQYPAEDKQVSHKVNRAKHS
jgi:uncharacterized membrane protein YjjP (DUF1212 family)